jgi:hypothetical protein
MSNELMAPRKNKRNEASRAIAQAIIEQYQPNSAEDIQDALRDYGMSLDLCLKLCCRGITISGMTLMTMGQRNFMDNSNSFSHTTWNCKYHIDLHLNLEIW